MDVGKSLPALRRPVSVLDKPLSKGKGEVSIHAFAFLFAEMVQYAQKRVNGVDELEQKLAEFGGRVGVRMLELLVWREKNLRRETRVVGILSFIHTTVFRALFGKPADSLERSNEREDEYMIQDNDPVIAQFISVPKELSGLSCAAFTAGVVEAILERSQFPARVTAHSTAQPNLPYRTTIFVKFDPSVMERERKLEAK